jgi:isopenicillin-N epimerase
MQYHDLFLLKEDITFLNHGSFGACPKPIYEDWQHWQLELEREPVQFFVNRGMQVMQESKAALGKFINADPADIVFTTNPTYAINIVAKSLKLQPGDEILASNHEYGAMERTWNYYCKLSGAKFVSQKIELPWTSKEYVIESFWKGYTKNTKVIFLNHISSATALIFPVKEIVDEAKRRGLITIIDGAHVPAHIALDIQELDADIYTGANHKWMMTPKGNSFLYVRKELQSKLDPLLISWGYESPLPSPNVFHDYHEMQGTRDYTSFLTVPAALRFFEDYNWQSEYQRCKTDILNVYPEMCELVNSKPICPVSADFLGQMASIPLKAKDPIRLKNELYQKYRIEIPVFSWNNNVYVRISLNGYNDLSDITTLKNALIELRNNKEIE